MQFRYKMCTNMPLSEILSVKTQLSMKAPNCGEDFPTWLIERSISHRGKYEFADIRGQRKNKHTWFYMKPQFVKNHGEKGDNSLFSRSYSELSRANTLFTISDLIQFLLEVAWFGLDLFPLFLVQISVYKYPESHNWWCGSCGFL